MGCSQVGRANRQEKVMVATLGSIGCQTGRAADTGNKLTWRQPAGPLPGALGQGNDGRLAAIVLGPVAEEMIQGVLMIGNDDFKDGARATGNAQQLSSG